jgi:hypothetical protein
MGVWDLRAWYWLANYVVALGLAVILAGILGDAPLFTATTFGETALSASRLVQFVGYGAAVVLFWLLGFRVAAQIPDTPLLAAIIRRLMTPLVTLVSCSGLYKILLLIGDPFLTKTGRQLYDWTFVLLIMASAAWVTMAAFWMAQQPAEEVSVQDEEDCPQCRTALTSGMRFCGACGATVAIE